MIHSQVIGADIGGSHISAALVDLHEKALVTETYLRAQVNSYGTVEEILSAWCNPIEQLLNTYKLPETKISLALPGPFDYEKGISYIKGNDKYEALYGLNIKNLLSKKLGINPACIRMKNDAACFLQGEAIGGSAKGFINAIGLTLGTGIGTARYHDGISENADLWHTTFRDSIVEEYLSTRWFIKRYHELTGTRVKNVKELADRIASDIQVKVVFDEFAESLSTFLSEFIRRDNPEVIVIGGNITNAAALFLPKVEKYLQRKSIYANIRTATLGENAPIIGAASCWFEKGIQDVEGSVNVRHVFKM